MMKVPFNFKTLLLLFHKFTRVTGSNAKVYLSIVDDCFQQICSNCVMPS